MIGKEFFKAGHTPTVPVDGTPDDAARRYERSLQEAYGAAILDPARPLFDVTLLGPRRRRSYVD
jgi:6-phosphogluconolactonase